MMLRDSQFFLPALAGIVAFLATSDQGCAQDQGAFYLQAAQKFGGPSHITLSDASNAGLESWKSPSELIESAVVLDWNDKELSLVRPDSSDKVLLPSPRVMNIQVHWQNPAAKELAHHLQKRNYSQAISLGSQLLSTKDEALMLPRWQQRVAISLLIQSSVGTDRWERAALLYLSLAKSQSPPLLLSSIPIPWTSSSAAIGERAQMQSLAKDWIADPNDSIQLLGAAWLLDGSARSEASQTLQRLTREGNAPWIRQFAQAQLWRTVPPNQITTETLDRWTSLRDSIPLPMQAGPTYLLAEKLASSTHHARACEEWIRILTLHPEQPFLVDQAKESLIPFLQSIGDHSTLERIKTMEPK